MSLYHFTNAPCCQCPVCSGTLANIGKCLGTLTRVSPIPTGEVVYDHEMSNLIAEVRSAAADRLSFERMTLAACVTVPVVVG